ncbi:CST complex subunit STN1 [Vigna radiata var. radiata]|uniref:CST complex subunit STN1 n=1 Tax=Vigna radiata var. radiata TaxID=3916 RepID=A0A1S3VQV8_VIGRR|nr:CST complex subunit STN1 [Vigna radiata var. radiata]
MENGNNNALALQNTHVKLLAFDLLSLTQFPFRSPDAATSFFRRGIQISRVETLGTVTLRHLKPERLLRFAIDDGTGCVPCVLWLNDANSPSVVRRRRHELAARFVEVVKFGAVARVRGRLSRYKGGVQVTVSDVVTERDPNAEIFHLLDCIRLISSSLRDGERDESLRP